jgi:hypothetical protein
MPPDGGSFEPQASSLLTAGPHSGTTFDIIGSVGVAILVIVGATVLMDRLPRLRRLAKPVIAVGTMSLTAYVGHFVAQSVLSTPAGTSTQQSWLPLIMYVLGAIVFATIWSRFFRRGPWSTCSTPPPSRRSTSDDSGPGWLAATSHPGLDRSWIQHPAHGHTRQ